jgi:hypothetical protein
VLIAVSTALATWSLPAGAQQQAQGFALDRLYLSAPGGGWFVMDTLDIPSGLGGVMAFSTWYAHDPLRVRSIDGSQRLAVVSDEALADFGFAATYDRFRLYVNFDMPLYVGGQGGTIGDTQFAAPGTGIPFTPSGVDPGTAPDTFADARIGVDARLLGSRGSAFRLGWSAQLFIPGPNENRGEYLTDDAFRAMFRVLFAGDVGHFTYAGQLGAHLRPLDDSSAPGGPQGSELLFGLAGGARWPLGANQSLALVVGPEVFGETAFRSFLGKSATGVEGLLTGRIEGTRDDGPQVRVRLGVGPGISQYLGTPEWRVVAGIELFDHDHRGAPDKLLVERTN